jgi:large subunit ribosomal protein L24
MKPTKQRKMLFQAPDHIRYKHFAAPLSPELRTSHGTRNLPVRSGDTVRVMRGDHKGFEGKVTRIDRNEYKIYVEGLTREKVDGTTVFVPIDPSKVMITRLNLDDKWRKKILERRKGIQVKEKEIVEKPAEEAAKVKEEVAEEKATLEEEPPKKKARKKKKTKEPTAEKMEEKPKARKPRAKRKTEKPEGGT